jgi:hypothetical protein
VNARAALAVLVAALASASASTRAAAPPDACPRPGDPAAGPLAGGVGPADFGAVPEACGATDAALRLRAALLFASALPDDYRRFAATTTLRGRYQLGERATLSAAADVFDYLYVDNAGLVSKGPSAGPATVTFQQTFMLGTAMATALYARLLLPLDTARQHSLVTGLEIGGAIRRVAGSRVVIDGGLALAAPVDIAGGQAHVALQPIALAEAWVRLGSWAALAGGVDARVAAAPELDLISLVPRVAARFAVRRRWWTAILLELPAAGSDRTDLVGGVYAGFSPS